MPYSHLQRAHHFVEKFGELHVIVVCFNPMRFVSRYTLTREFIERAEAAGAVIHVAEVAFGERPFEIIGKIDLPCHVIPLRSAHELWLKESIINTAVARLPGDWKYVAWVDADVAFTNPHWVQETIQQLQHYAVVQMFETAHDLAPDHKIMREFVSVTSAVQQEGDYILTEQPEQYDYYVFGRQNVAHPGYAWACTRSAWDTMGGLLDFNIVGGGDRQMAFGLYGKMQAATFDGASVAYRARVLAWAEHAAELKRNVGYVPGSLLHYWHGKKVNRHYYDRWQILARNDFNPLVDLKRDWQGLWQLAGNKPQLRDDMRAYFRSRQEDSIDAE